MGMSTETLPPLHDGPGPATSEVVGLGPAVDPAGSLVTRQVDGMVAAWRRGERLLVEDVLARHPELGDDGAIRLIYEEFCLRQEAGDPVDPDEIARRFPQWRDELAVLLDCQRLMESAPARVVFPHVGELLAGFRLLAELGRGAAGRVFLAAQPSLGDRPVVVKVTPRGREEHLSLARLQHMNIVPLYSEHAIRDRNLRLLCMPFLGGATLAQVLDALEDQPAAQRTGEQIVEVLDRIQARRPSSVQPGGPYRRFFARASYVEAVCSIGAAMADGLQYAHERDLVHMDVKPSNALLAGDGQPMLLDFHLARSPIGPASPPPAWMGGTLEFMSPEHRRAMEAVREGRPVRDAVDGRTDIYSLGMLLYVALGGAAPESGEAAPVPLHRLNPRVSVGLSDVIHKCLRREPGDRYPDAASLAGDLRRHLADLPLRGVPNRSWAERWRKWRRRHPRALSRRGLVGLILLAAVAAPAATLGIAYAQRRAAAASALALGNTRFKAHAYVESAANFRQGLALIDRLPGFDRPRHELTEALDRAMRAGRVAALHELAETIRFRYGLSPPPADEAPALIRLGRETWEARDSLLRPIDGLPAPETGRRVRGDLRDLVLLWADLRVRYASANDLARAREEAIGILAGAAAVLGTSPSLERDRSVYAGAGGLDAPSPGGVRVPRSAWEHYDLGRSYLRSGKPALAIEQFRRGLVLRPQDFWLNFYEGLCDYRLGRFDGAVNAFRVCIALAPKSAECFYNRARAYEALDRLELSLSDYDRALSINPRLTDAYLNRGIIRLRQDRHDAAIADLQRALKTTASRRTLGIIHYNLAVVHQARGDRRAAAASARAASELGNPEARELARRLVRPAASSP
jgi:serine/threonine protein kinase/tetratricopeptide (TPR) repeat protein